MKLLDRNAASAKAALAALAFMASSVPAAEARAAAAQIVAVEGEVWITPPEGKETRAAPGSNLAAGTRIRTGNGHAELRFENGSILKVRPNSSMSLSGNKRAQAKKASVVLFFGRLWSKIVRGGDSGYEVTTANAVCGVRGTEFETAVADDGSIRVRVDEGVVAVTDDHKEYGVERGEEIQGNEEGLAAEGQAQEKTDWEGWREQKKKRLESQSRGLVDSAQQKIMARKAKIEALRARQKEIEKKRKAAEARARRGDRGALDEVKRYNHELAQLADAIADLGDQAASQFGMVDHYADLAKDPRFRMVDRKYLISQAESLRRVKADLDRMVADGTDISMEAMEALLDDMGSGKGGGLKDDRGSSAKDLFGDDPF